MIGDSPTDLESQRRYYETLIKVSPTAIVTCDGEFRVRSWNPAAEKLFGYSSAEAIGRHIDDLTANRDALQPEPSAVNEELLEHHHIQVMARRTRKDGSLVDVSIRAAA